MTNPSDPKSPPPSWWIRAYRDIQERFDGILEFLGAITFAVGGWRQVFFAIALSSIAGGLGLSVEHGIDTNGHRWMSVGGFLLGLIWPLKKQG